MRTLILTVVAFALSAVAIEAADTPPLVIYGDSSVAGFRPGTDGGRLSAAIARFGEPASVRRSVGDYGINYCAARWPALGMTLRFNPYKPGCVPESSCFHEATLTGKGWRTAKGLRVGDTRQRLYQLYPRLKARGLWRTLLTRPGLENTYPALEAKLVALRVVAFRVVVPACEGFRG